MLGLKWVIKKLSAFQVHFCLFSIHVHRAAWFSTEIPCENKNLGLAEPCVHSFPHSTKYFQHQPHTEDSSRYRDTYTSDPKKTKSLHSSRLQSSG